MCLEWHKGKQRCLLWKTQTGWVSLPVLSSPDRSSLVLTHKCCFIHSSPFLSPRLSTLVRLSLSPRKMTFCIKAIWPLCLPLSERLSNLAANIKLVDWFKQKPLQETSTGSSVWWWIGWSCVVRRTKGWIVLGKVWIFVWFIFDIWTLLKLKFHK